MEIHVFFIFSSIVWSLFVFQKRGEISLNSNNLKYSLNISDINTSDLMKEWREPLRYSDTFVYKDDYLKYSKPFTDSKKNVLIIGNSHSISVYNSLYDSNVESFSFTRYGFNIEEFSEDSSEFKFLINSQIFQDADIFVIANRLQSHKIHNVEAFIRNIKKIKKPILIMNSRPETNPFRIYSVDSNTDFVSYILSQEKVFNKFFNDYKFPIELNLKNINKINSKFYYQINWDNLNFVNREIFQFKDKYKIKIYDQTKRFCPKFEYCHTLTPEGRKIFFDSSHLTRVGGKYIYSDLEFEILKLFSLISH